MTRKGLKPGIGADFIFKGKTMRGTALAEEVLKIKGPVPEALAHELAEAYKDMMQTALRMESIIHQATKTGKVVLQLKSGGGDETEKRA